MAKFDQRGQKVTNQINADSVGVVNFGTVQNKAELIAELRKLLLEVNKATETGIIKEEVAVDVEAQIKKAVIESEKSEPKKKSILEYLEEAKKLLDGVTSATGLVTALVQAIKIIGGLLL